MTTTTTTPAGTVPAIGTRDAEGRTWTGWAGWQRCAVAVPVVRADELEAADDALAEVLAERDEARALTAAWQQEALTLRRELMALRRQQSGGGVAAG